MTAIHTSVLRIKHNTMDSEGSTQKRVYFHVEGDNSSGAGVQGTVKPHEAQLARVAADNCTPGVGFRHGSTLLCTRYKYLLLRIGHRYFTREHAQAYQVTGWVRNRSDGNVSEGLPGVELRKGLTPGTRSRAKLREARERWASS